MAKCVHVAGISVSCMSSVPRAFVRTPNSCAALTIHTKLFAITRVKRVHARVHTHACVKFKVSGTVLTTIHTYECIYVCKIIVQVSYACIFTHTHTHTHTHMHTHNN